jgi:hypothetical protein
LDDEEMEEEASMRGEGMSMRKHGSIAAALLQLGASGVTQLRS